MPLPIALSELLDERPWNEEFDIETALEQAIVVLTLSNNNHNRDAAKVLKAILDQNGCEHLDCGVPNTGRLVDAISVIVFG